MLDMLKKIAEEEGGHIENENTTLTQTNLDSFGFAIFWFTVMDKMGVKFDADWVSSIDYESFTIAQLIAKIEELKSEAKK